MSADGDSTLPMLALHSVRPVMTWRLIEHDDKHRVPFLVYRCRACGKLGVNTNPLLTMTPCVCSKR